jgi:hypothetical protein
MRRTLIAACAAVLALAMLATITGCTRVRLQDSPSARTYTDNKTVPLAGATRLQTVISIGVGELTVVAADTSASVGASGSAEASGAAMVGSFIYTPKDWVPEVTYAVAGDTGTLRVRQNDRLGGFPFGRPRNTWNLRLPANVPTDLTLTLGVGESTIDLRGADLTDLNVRTGVGATTIDLSGAHTADLGARVEAGVGSLTLRVPRNVGVRVTGRKDGVGDFAADGFTAQGNTWVNDAYSAAGPKIEIDLVRGVGDVTLVMVD